MIFSTHGIIYNQFVILGGSQGRHLLHGATFFPIFNFFMNNNNTQSQSSGISLWFKPKVVLIFLAMILLAGIVIISILREKIVRDQNWQVSMVGQGRVTYEPDTAIVSLGVQVDKAQTAEAALQEVNTKMATIVNSLETLGVSKENIITQNYSVYPHYDTINDSTKVTGYTANQLLNVKIYPIKDNDDNVQSVIAAVSKAGANQITGITFETSKLNDLKQQARLSAIKDAKSKASELSTALGVELGEVVGWWENTIKSPEVYGYYKGDYVGFGGGAGGAPVTPSGASEIIIEVNITYQLE